MLYLQYFESPSLILTVSFTHAESSTPTQPILSFGIFQCNLLTADQFVIIRIQSEPVLRYRKIVVVGKII